MIKTNFKWIEKKTTATNYIFLIRQLTPIEIIFNVTKKCCKYQKCNLQINIETVSFLELTGIQCCYVPICRVNQYN